MSSPRVLVVEDHEDSRLAIAQALRTDGYEVIEATDGLEAMRIVRTLIDAKVPLPIIVTDVFMPNTSGLTFAAAVRTLGYRGPLAVVTASTAREVRDAAEQLDARVFVKPIDLIELREHVKRVTGLPA
jgi:CheY-like chemotaxis protein